FVDELFRDGPALAVSALGRGGTDATAFRDGLRQDVNDITDFRRRHGDRVAIGVYETRLPAGVPADDLTELLVSAARLTGAGEPAAARGLDGGEVRDLIEDEDAGSFLFGDDGLRWHTHRASVTEIEFARRSAVVSFGSCSFDEPRDDLRELGLL